MNDRERNYIAILAQLERARVAIGTVNPQYSYYERLARLAWADDGALAELQGRIEREGGLC